jgi:hypothetical protein
MKFNNRLKKSKENIENTLGEREPLRVWRSWGEGESNPSQVALGEPCPPQEREDGGFARFGFEGVLSPLIYIGWNLRLGHVWDRSQTYLASRICPGHRPNMFGEICLIISRNIGNCPKNWYSMDFGIGPIEYICVWHMDTFWKTKYIYIWLETIRIIKHG